jgi:hypothetical protein
MFNVKKKQVSTLKIISKLKNSKLIYTYHMCKHAPEHIISIHIFCNPFTYLIKEISVPDDFVTSFTEIP